MAAAGLASTFRLRAAFFTPNFSFKIWGNGHGNEISEARKICDTEKDVEMTHPLTAKSKGPCHRRRAPPHLRGARAQQAVVLSKANTSRLCDAMRLAHKDNHHNQDVLRAISTVPGSSSAYHLFTDVSPQDFYTAVRFVLEGAKHRTI